MAEEKYNMKNPTVKRILQDVKEMQANPSDDFMSLPLEENIFERKFAIRGPRDTEFEGGIYYGWIQLPVEYPFQPPAFMLLTPNGRFETQMTICLSISNHHPEHWQPSWSVGIALVALIAFMPTNLDGALGSLDYKKGERRALAIKSREAAPQFGTPERQKLIDEIHQCMLSKAPPIP
ncbi:PREDICTED: ubiquitin-conjugating enzyme E2 32-like [Nelumbo nucifera]|uniref:Ubiquitin-conjugating enzyme E2 32-like n=1 Tax=Nelumbo nucifera TaxID=4432 RepID=A0A1U8Q4Z6_NELNU|nr:PREDICTED: ubiquitin-conjugating enzyme E2 32-like [Nelumbo nucifera]